MKLNKYDKQAIVRAIMNDVPKPDKVKRRIDLQTAIVKAMSPECRKVFKTAPGALKTEYFGDVIYDGLNWKSRDMVVGDVTEDKLEELAKPYKDEDALLSAAECKLKGAVEACTTLKQLETRLPEFKKYFPTAAKPVATLPALANVVADLSKLGWPKTSTI
ncbi:hypothetical protein UFOVP232_19 [uncultured Caudovirales phage]|uniref:Nucleotide modification associated domain-containing protein n=1 Tax=uncultured Caudovirales phage TaxID=2100421 RepID=A0A6J7WT61_9CAUD|nr:hypothetical protein UFOVP232_19 [uncultured Caudovirales phage]